ncbi:hypothetical protein FHX37_0647 [Haloactinospora alba]|uniref:Uncharacterized protein n=1 Tax=Haloactinospora alba TaxID=405555 RepID=A0A543NG44_9ACTN|nr:hypothetical protein FHX37_0647 [Haloactinospora alba]
MFSENLLVVSIMVVLCIPVGIEEVSCYQSVEHEIRENYDGNLPLRAENLAEVRDMLDQQ